MSILPRSLLLLPVLMLTLAGLPGCGGDEGDGDGSSSGAGLTGGELDKCLARAREVGGSLGKAGEESCRGKAPAAPNIPGGAANIPPSDAPNIPDESPTDSGDEGGGSAGRYPAEVRDNFVRSCTARPNATTAECECALGKIEAQVSFRDFKRAEVATRAGSRVDPQIQAQFTNAIADCSQP